MSFASVRTASACTRRGVRPALRYQGPPANLTQGDANLAQLAMTAQFYRRDAVAASNLTHLRPNLAQLRTTLQ